MTDRRTEIAKRQQERRSQATSYTTKDSEPELHLLEALEGWRTAEELIARAREAIEDTPHVKRNANFPSACSCPLHTFLALSNPNIRR